MSDLSRTEISRRADRVIASLDMASVRAPAGETPKTCAILASEGTAPAVVRRCAIQSALNTVGLHADGLDEILADIAASPNDDGAQIPVMVLVDGWVQVAWARTMLLSRGGDA